MTSTSVREHQAERHYAKCAIEWLTNGREPLWQVLNHPSQLVKNMLYGLRHQCLELKSDIVWVILQHGVSWKTMYSEGCLKLSCPVMDASSSGVLITERCTSPLSA